jgi:hypothetical protein
MADFRNHRHHGLVGALVVEPTGATPTKYYGSRATVGLPYGEPFEEAVLILQDGLRLFLHGNVSFPIPDEPGDAPGEAPDPEDQGQKGFNYRSEPVGEPRWIHLPEPATPVFAVRRASGSCFGWSSGRISPGTTASRSTTTPGSPGNRRAGPAADRVGVGVVNRVCRDVRFRSG